MALRKRTRALLLVGGTLTTGAVTLAVSSEAATLVGVVRSPGAEDYSLPAIGKVWFATTDVAGGPDMCTGTLVSADLVLSAAHCSEFTTGSGGSGDRFEVFSSRNSSPKSFPIRDFWSFGAQLGPGDFVIIRLATAVPAEVATPIQLSASCMPNQGTTTVFGFGCINPRGDGLGIKRSARVPMPIDTAQNGVLCKGDSGGPMLLYDGSTPYVVAVNSAFYEDDVNSALINRDMFAEICGGTQTALSNAIASIEAGRTLAPTSLAQLATSAAAQPASAQVPDAGLVATAGPDAQ